MSTIIQQQTPNLILPPDYDQIKVVESLSEMATQQFDSHSNAFVQPGKISPTCKFNALAKAILRERSGKDAEYFLDDKKNLVTPIKNQRLRISLDLQRRFPEEIETIMDDLTAMKSKNYDMSLVIEDHGHIPYFHRDVRHPDGRVIKYYTNSSTKYVRNEDAGRPKPKSIVCEINPGATIYEFGIGNTWRFSTLGNPGSSPFVHGSDDGCQARMYLINDI